MENNKNMRELYKLYLELGHDVFEEKIKKPLELYYLHNNHDGGDVISMFFNINIANDMESSKLGDDTFDEHDIFSPPTFEEKIYFDDTLLPIYDYNDEYDVFSPPTIEDKFIMIMICLINTMITMMIMIALLSLFLIRKILLI